MNKFSKNLRTMKGFTLMEIVIALAIMVFIVSAVYVFLGNITDASFRVSNSLLVQQEINQALQILVPELRSAAQSNTGVYPIIEATSSSIRFYSDIDRDAIFEEVHYYLDGDVFTKGVVEPSGNPLIYNPADEKTRALVNNMVVGTQIFYYYSGQATSTYAAALPFPINILDISKVKISLNADQGTPNNPSITGIEDFATIRNLRFGN